MCYCDVFLFNVTRCCTLDSYNEVEECGVHLRGNKKNEEKRKRREKVNLAVNE